MSKVIYLSELSAKIKKEPPPTDQNSIMLQIRLPNGKVVKRRFSKTQNLSEILDFCKVELDSPEELKLICSYPRKPYTDLKMLVGNAFNSDSSVIAEYNK